MSNEKYKFSIPMPYNKEHLDIINNINKMVEKSEINSFYFSLPLNCPNLCGFEQARNTSNNSSYEHWLDLIETSNNNGYDVIYTLNTPNPTLENKDDIEYKLEKLDNLIKDLCEIGCNKFRVSNLRLLYYLTKTYPNIILYSSTSFEYKTIKEYENFIKLYPNIKQIVPSHDLNKNFKVLKNLKTKLNNIEIELIVNEGCLGGCPLRREHSCFVPYKSNQTISIFKNDYFIEKCFELFDEDIFLQIFKSNLIFPWDIKEYGKIGIKNFKLVGRDFFANINSGNLYNDYYDYLKGIDDYKNIENKSLSIFIHRLRNEEKLKYHIKDIKPYMPQIDHFKKYGHLCSSICNVECKYCYICADKIKKIIKYK